MIKEIIKENMEYLNLTNKDVSLLTGITTRTIRNILDGKTKPTLENIYKIESALKLERADLIPYMDVDGTFVDDKTLFNKIDKTTNTLYAKETIISKLRRLVPGGIDNYKSYLINLSPEFSKYKDKDLAYFWIALNEKKIEGIKPDTILTSNAKKSLISNYLKIMFTNKSFDIRVKNMKDYLFDNGIVLVNSPFINGSSIKGITLKKNGVRYIFMSDMYRKEWSYVFTLGHELMHIAGQETENNDKLSNMIEKYLEKNNIKHDVLIAIEHFKQTKTEKWTDVDFKYIYNNTSSRVEFGKEDEFIKQYLGI